MASLAGISARAVSFYETGERPFTLALAIKFSEIFECSIDYLLCKTDVRNNKIEINKIYVGILQDCDKNQIPPDQLEDLISVLKKINKK